jgi:hypothetical protein
MFHTLSCLPMYGRAIVTAHRTIPTISDLCWWWHRTQITTSTNKKFWNLIPMCSSLLACEEYMSKPGENLNWEKRCGGTIEGFRVLGTKVTWEEREREMYVPVEHQRLDLLGSWAHGWGQCSYQREFQAAVAILNHQILVFLPHQKKANMVGHQSPRKEGNPPCTTQGRERKWFW